MRKQIVWAAWWEVEYEGTWLIGLYTDEALAYEACVRSIEQRYGLGPDDYVPGDASWYTSQLEVQDA